MPGKLGPRAQWALDQLPPDVRSAVERGERFTWEGSWTEPYLHLYKTGGDLWELALESERFFVDNGRVMHEVDERGGPVRRWSMSDPEYERTILFGTYQALLNARRYLSDAVVTGADPLLVISPVVTWEFELAPERDMYRVRRARPEGSRSWLTPKAFPVALKQRLGINIAETGGTITGFGYADAPDPLAALREALGSGTQISWLTPTAGLVRVRISDPAEVRKNAAETSPEDIVFRGELHT